MIADRVSSSGPTAKVLVVRWALLVAVGFHFGAIALVSLRELSWLIANGLTVVPTTWRNPARNFEDFSIAALAENFEPGNSYHQAIATYLNLAGIQGGYGFFAPNVSDTYRLVFEFQFPDGHVEQDLPHVSSAESAVRLSGLLDEIGRTQIDLLREALVKLLAEETWQYHPDATTVRVTFRSTKVAPAGPPRADGADQILYSYELGLTPKNP